MSFAEGSLYELIEMEEAPWGNLRGKPINPRSLANFLRPYDVKSKTVRIGIKTPKGYTREDLHDPWSRYLGVPPDESETSATGDTDTHESITI